MIKINATRSNLNKIITWSTSRYNEFRKMDAIDRMLEQIDTRDKVSELYSAGSYTEAGGGSGIDYKFEIKDGRIFLSSGTIEMFDLNVKKKVELIKGSRRKYPVPKGFKL